ncbi:MAG: hypothetical protein JRN68_08235 [Nitrososphaerota archaeon]|jgi:uncharacterized protein YciI|nr:hypothetical protein [Nitrososphaerota archaeon]
MPHFIVITSNAKDELRTKELSDAHMSYLKMLQDEGKLEFAGRFVDGEGGLYALNVSDRVEAEKLAARDPYHSSGYRKYMIRGWERRL